VGRLDRVRLGDLDSEIGRRDRGGHSRSWPAGKRQFELRERIREARDRERRTITTRLILRGGVGLVVLHLVSLGLKDRSTP
jgi:hypothetical protein